MVLTGSVISNSYVDTGLWVPAREAAASSVPGEHRTLLFAVRVTGALVSQVIWWNGIWGVFDSHIVRLLAPFPYGEKVVL
jgi:hypothetical protein